jgi:hypothetical protein
MAGRLTIPGLLAVAALAAVVAFIVWKNYRALWSAEQTAKEAQREEPPAAPQLQPTSISLRDRWKNAAPRKATLDTGGFGFAITSVTPWRDNATLREISNAWQRVGFRGIQRIDQVLANENRSPKERVSALLSKASLFNYEGQPQRAYEVLCQARAIAEAHDDVAVEQLYSIIYMQASLHSAAAKTRTASCAAARAPASCRLLLRPCTPTRRGHGRRSCILRNTSSSSPTTWRCAGC